MGGNGKQIPVSMYPREDIKPEQKQKGEGLLQGSVGGGKKGTLGVRKQMGRRKDILGKDNLSRSGLKMVSYREGCTIFF